jgi:hypothetical protein
LIGVDVTTLQVLDFSRGEVAERFKAAVLKAT